MNKLSIGMLAVLVFVAQRRVPAAELTSGLVSYSKTAYYDLQVDVRKVNLQINRTRMADAEQDLKEKKEARAQTGNSYRASMYRYGLEDEGTRQKKGVYDVAQVDYKSSDQAHRASSKQVREDIRALNRAQKDQARNRRESEK